jgi:hypothetical protein
LKPPKRGTCPRKTHPPPQNIGTTKPPPPKKRGKRNREGARKREKTYKAKNREEKEKKARAMLLIPQTKKAALQYFPNPIMGNLNSERRLLNHFAAGFASRERRS